SCGGEPMSPEIPRQVFALFDVELWNGYGPTETTIRSSQWRCRRDWSDPTIPIGTPLANTTFYVLDRYRQPVPLGVPGELYIGGVGVARGYLNRPELTAERFLPDPFSPQPGARVYRTGDLVRYRPDGALEFLGRLDDQVKLRGFRIELGEIEAVVGHAPGVGQAVVLLREDRPGEKRLVAYVVADAEAAPSPDEVRRYAGQFLPAYMIPSSFVVLEAFPLMPNGKLDRGALPAPEATAPLEAYVAPCGPAEQTLAGIWADVLGLDRVGIHDNFFELGGDSIRALQIVARATQAGLPLAPRHLFQAQTVADLAALVGSEGSAASEPSMAADDLPPSSEQSIPERPTPPSGVPSPSDFPLAQLDQQRLDRLLARLPRLKDAE
ncbi:MAG TPA: AMP-binding protein, partial [Thermomicrobiaceae bacterium]|nr:AMP-binding protein [Thermomicrobiaceae bacterium]